MQYVNGLDVAECIYQEVNSIFRNKTLKWEEVSVAAEDNCKVYAVDNPLYEGGLLFKCIGIVNCPSDIPWNILYKTENQMKWDKFCIKSKTVEVYDQLNFIDFLAYASPAAGVPRYFSLFRTCRMNFQNKIHCQVYTSIDHSESEKEIGGNLSGVESFIELKPSGWFIEEIEPNVTKITFITNLPASSMEPYLPNVTVNEMREMYRKSAMHCRFKIPDLINHIKINYISQLDKSLTVHNYRTLEIFKEVCDVIGSFDEEKWSFFRKVDTLECYYKDLTYTSSNNINNNGVSVFRVLFSDTFVVNSTLEIIQSFLFSKNSHLVDSWTYDVELVETISKETEIFSIKFRSVLCPTHEVKHYLLKQVNQLPTGVLFVGYKSIFYKEQSEDKYHPFWFLSSGFIITPLNNNNHNTIQSQGQNQWLVRSIVQSDKTIGSIGTCDILTYCLKRKILWAFSEKSSHFHQSLKIIINQFNSKKMKTIKFPHWNTLGNKTFDELLDLFFKMAISHNGNNELEDESDSDDSIYSSCSSENSSISSNSNPSSPTLSPLTMNDNDNNNNNRNNQNNNSSSSSKKKTDRKRKFVEHEKTSIVSVNQTFCFSNSRNDVLQPLPFTPNWENFIKRKPFLLLVNSKKSLEPLRKLIKTNHNEENSTFYILPSEILNYILTFFTARDLSNISRTCKLLHKATTNDFLWKELFELKWNNNSIFNFNINIDKKQQTLHSQLISANDINMDNNNLETNNNNNNNISNQKIIGISPDLNNSNSNNDTESSLIPSQQEIEEDNLLNDPSISNNINSQIPTPVHINNCSSTNIDIDIHSNFGTWRKLYMLKDNIENNWRTGKPRISILKGHESKINCLQFNQDSLLTASKDRELRVWNLSLKKCDTVLKTSSNSNLIAFEKDNLSKWSNEIFPYCLHNPEILRLGFMNGQILNLNTKTQTISSAQRFSFLADGFVFDKSNVYIWESGNMQLWDQSTGQKTHNLTLNTKIKQFKLNRNHVRALACCDKTVKLWDSNSNAITLQLTGHKGIVNNVEFYGDHSLISTACKNIRLWDIRNPNIALNDLNAHTSKVGCLSSSRNSQRFTTTDTNNLLIWQSTLNFSKVDLLSTIPLNTEYGHVDCLAMDDESIVMGYSKGVVAFLDFYK